MQDRSARGTYTQLDGLRSSFMTRCEKYAGYTLPRLCLPNGADEINTEIVHDYQAVGAQAGNHLANRLMLTMFAPSRPFIRLALSTTALAEALQSIKQEEIEAALAEGEQKAVKEMDNQPGFRAKLYEVLLNLEVLGNVCLHLPKKGDATVYGLRDYVVRRTRTGKIKQAIVKECVLVDELEDDVRGAYEAALRRPVQDNTKVSVYHKLDRAGKQLIETTWVEEVQLDGAKFNGNYTDDDCPWHFLTWNLKHGAHYGTGLVEDYAGDFGSLSALSKAQIEGAILASEFRWLANPSGVTKPEDFEGSENGAVIPGVEGDLSLVTNSKPGDLRVVREIGEDYVRRIGQGFLLGSAMTRDAERVTAEEIRTQAMELETSLGGVYTRLASTLQKGVAMWLLHKIDVKVADTKIEVQIITGLDALSRNGDLAALRSALADIAGLEPLSQSAIGQELNIRAIITAIFVGHGVPTSKYLATDEQKTAAAEQAKVDQAASAGIEAGAQQIAKGPQ